MTIKNREQLVKILLLSTALTLCILTTFCSDITLAAGGDELVAKATASKNSFFAFAKKFSIPVGAILLIFLFMVKKAAAGSGNAGKEAAAAAGIVGVIIAFISIQWGNEIWLLISGIFK